MNRQKGVIVALSVFALAGAVKAATNGYEERREAAYKKAEAERQKLGLDGDREKLYAKYGTPVVKTPDKVARVCAGKTAAVSLKGTFVKGSTFIVESNQVQVVKEKATETSWDAELKVNGDALPEELSVTVMSPVSAASMSAKVLDLGCKYAWHLELKNGEAVDLVTDFAADPKLTDGAWTKGGKAEGKWPYTFTGGGTSFTFNRVVGEDEVKSSVDSAQAFMTSPEYQALQTKMQAALGKLDKCRDPKTQLQCMKAPQAELEALGKEQQALQAKLAAKNALKYGCAELSPGLENGKVVGSAHRCGTAEDVEIVSGTVKPL